LDRVGGLIPQGGTRLIDTVQETYQKVQQLPAGKDIRAIIVLTDGADNRSTTTPDQLKQLLQADEAGNSIKVFTIAYGTGSDVDKGLLKTISDASGAMTYQSDPKQIDQVYRDIATFF